MKRDALIILLLTAVALGLRLWQLDSVPPGWRDDELINSLVISQKVLDGDWQLYYADASGHEGLYHILNAAFLGLFGPGVAGIRWLSVIMGTLTVPLTYLLGKLLYNSRWVGVVAALGLAVSFWSLMYSRIGLRHISLPFFMLPAFYFFLRPFFLPATKPQRDMLSFGLSALFMGLSFYTYFASRGVPLILLAWLIYVVVVDSSLVKKQWRGLLVMGLLTAVFAFPLAYVLQQQPEAEARVAELAAPVINAREGDFSLLQEHIIRTLNMFHSDGDDEWLYNIPFRPVFGPVGAIFFWLGVLFSFGYALRPLVQKLLQRSWAVDLPPQQTQAALASAFLLLWWLAGIAPAFLSIPPGSLGHTIVAQSAVYLLTAVPLFVLTQRRKDGKSAMRHKERKASQDQKISSAFSASSVVQKLFTNHSSNLQKVFEKQRNGAKEERAQRLSRKTLFFAPLLHRVFALKLFTDYLQLAMIFASALLLGAIAVRDLPAYFQEWPYRGNVRLLYRADLGNVADYVNTQEGFTEFGVTSLLPGPWDRVALDIELGQNTAVRPRFYNPERIILLNPPQSFVGYPVSLQPIAENWYDVHGPRTAGYKLATVQPDLTRFVPQETCFTNGFCLQASRFDSASGQLDLLWRVAEPLALPPMPLISNPPPPGVDPRPRLQFFAQQLDSNGMFIAGDDGLWVDVLTLHPNDEFIQRHYLPPTTETVQTIRIGQYDPVLNERIPTVDGDDGVDIR